MSTLDTGALVKARGREWVVLPESTDEVLMLRPLGGLDEEVTAVLPALEAVAPATFAPPDPARPGDFNACRLLRDAARLSTRAAAGPFRSFGRIAVEPRPYQLVPLLMAMRLNPVRLLIADDVGIGKTIEACLIARELLDRGEATRLAVLCPPPLAEQWQRELRDKFHIEAELVLTSTVRRLERGLLAGQSLFDRYPCVVVSTDFIKSPNHRDDFIRACPELVIVDEAHGCTIADKPGRARQQRFELVEALSSDPERHLLLVTATPHSGNEAAFRSLLSLLDPKFAELPMDLEKKEREGTRRDLARHLVQRRRADILVYEKELGSETFFPKRDSTQHTYALGKDYKAVFQKALRFAGEMVADDSGPKRHRRVRWWSALSLLRALASSPAAAAATLGKRAETAGAETDAEADERGQSTVFDEQEGDEAETIDFTPGSDASDETAVRSVRDRLRALAREAEALKGAGDAKLQEARKLIADLVKENRRAIVFCRFIDTAEYLAEELRKTLKNVEVAAVTGLLPPAERERRIEELAKHERRVLVCTDCLSEGINLQMHFDAVLHYDLPWNPTRLEQREGRVDRFGQRQNVRVLTYFGRDNGVDGVVLEVLLAKHMKIRDTLGISVAVPGSSEEVIQALFEGILLRQGTGATDAFLPGAEEWVKPRREELHKSWDQAVDREKVFRSRFAQLTIKTEDVARELAAVRDAIGACVTVRHFVTDALHLAGVPVTPQRKDQIRVEVSPRTDRSLRAALGRDEPFTGRFDLPVDEGVVHLARTHPIVEGLASWVLETALDEVEAEDRPPIARRCGLIRTKAVTTKTALMLVRFRYHLLVTRRGAPEKAFLAEEIRSLAFTGAAGKPTWLHDTATETLLAATPSANTPTSLITDQLKHLLGDIAAIERDLADRARSRGEALLEAHTRVRESARMTGRVRVEPVLPADLLGCFILLPAAS